MRHVPHLYIEQPWHGSALRISDAANHHVLGVLRLGDGAAVSYTDGNGRVGTGTLANGVVQRGEEQCLAPSPAAITVAVAPPRSNDRARFLVEKLGELGTERLIWIRTRYGNARPPRVAKSRAWAVAALEQSRGAWLMEFHDGHMAIDELEGDLLIADPAGLPISPAQSDVSLVIGPEGGLESDEITGIKVSLGNRILRVETAVIVGAALLRGNHHAEG